MELREEEKQQRVRNWKRWRLFAVLPVAYLLLVYVAALVPANHLLGNHCLPEWLQGKKHDDYYFSWTRWIPRAATSWCIEAPPIQLLGNQEREAPAPDGTLGPKPIPEPGKWQASIVQIREGWPLFLPYVAWTTERGTHYRFGARWDDVDHYYTFPSVAIAKPAGPSG